MSALQISFWSPWLLLCLPLSDHIPTSPPVLPRLFTFLSSVCQPQSSTTSNSPSSLFFIFLAVLRVHVLVPTSTPQSQWPCTLLCRAHPVQRSRWLSGTCMHTNNHSHWHTRSGIKNTLRPTRIYTELRKLSTYISIYLYTKCSASRQSFSQFSFWTTNTLVKFSQ